MLKGSHRKYLRGLAHDRRPLVQIGKGGLSETVLASVDAALEAHELVKIQIALERDDRRDVAAAIEQRLGCECVGMVGRMAIVYRQQPDPERRTIVLS